MGGVVVVRFWILLVHLGYSFGIQRCGKGVSVSVLDWGIQQFWYSFGIHQFWRSTWDCGIIAVSVLDWG